MVPPPPPPQSFGGEDNARSTSPDSSPNELVYPVFWVLKAHTLLDRPLPAGCAGGKDGKGDGVDDGGNTGRGWTHKKIS
jgi:hypothetical protein